MGAAGDQPISGPGIPALNQPVRGHLTEDGDRQMALGRSHQIATADPATVAPQAVRQSLVALQHPGEWGLRRQTQADAQSPGGGSHGRQIREIRRRCPPTDRVGGGCRLREMHPLHQQIGADHQGLTGVGLQHGGIIADQTGAAERFQLAQQFGFAQVADPESVRCLGHEKGGAIAPPSSLICGRSVA